MKQKIYNRRNKVFLLTGTVFIFFGVLISLTADTIFNYIQKSELVITPQHEFTFSLWKDIPFPITMDVYFFNWTNPQDIYNHSIKPRLKEVGPYRYREYKKKVDIVLNDNGTISFKQKRNWYFDPENSVGSSDDLITSINPVATAAVYQISNFNYFLQKSFSLTLTPIINQIHVTKKVDEILFNGYDDQLLNIANTLPSLSSLEIPPFEKFGWFVTRNGSKDYEGTLSMGTGTGDIPFGQLTEWNFSNKTKYYKDECSIVHGSAGEFFRSHLKKEDVELFFTDLCRPLNLQYEKSIHFDGIPVSRYIAGKKSFDNGTLYEKNKCYCEEECIPSGLTSASECRYGAPGFISLPHFFEADPIYLKDFEGLKPEKEKHEFFVLIEPITGIPMKVDGKFQINLLLRPNNNVRIFRDVPKLYFPIFWFREQVTISDEIAASFKWFLRIPTLLCIITVVLYAIGSLFFIPILLSLRKKYFLCGYSKDKYRKGNIKEMEPLAHIVEYNFSDYKS